MYADRQENNQAKQSGNISGSYLGEGAMRAEPPRQPEIQAHVQDLAKCLGAFDAVLSDLYKKLAPVCRTEPDKEMTSEAVRGASTELGCQLSELCSRMTMMRNYAQRMTARIEL